MPKCRLVKKHDLGTTGTGLCAPVAHAIKRVSKMASAYSVTCGFKRLPKHKQVACTDDWQTLRVGSTQSC